MNQKDDMELICDVTGIDFGELNRLCEDAAKATRGTDAEDKVVLAMMRQQFAIDILWGRLTNSRSLDGINYDFESLFGPSGDFEAREIFAAAFLRATKGLNRFTKAALGRFDNKCDEEEFIEATSEFVRGLSFFSTLEKSANAFLGALPKRPIDLH